jgi:hypothetical protein
MDALACESILTCRANQVHDSIIAQFAKPPMAAARRAPGAMTGQEIPTIEIAPARDGE